MVTREELLAKLGGTERLTLVEALGAAYFADAHLPGAINIPPDQVDRLAPLLLPDAGAHVVVYSSRTGEGAAMVARRLGDLGYTQVGVLAGGKEEWIEHGLPVERP